MEIDRSQIFVGSSDQYNSDIIIVYNGQIETKPHGSFFTVYISISVHDIYRNTHRGGLANLHRFVLCRNSGIKRLSSVWCSIAATTNVPSVWRRSLDMRLLRWGFSCVQSALKFTKTTSRIWVKLWQYWTTSEWSNWALRLCLLTLC